MTTLVRSGLVQLVRSVRDYFTANGIDADVTIGWRERPKQVQGGRSGRVVFQPGDDQGKAGPIIAPQQTGPRKLLDANNNHVGNIRALWDWSRLSIVNVWAIDPTAPTDEEAAIEAIEALFEATQNAVHVAPGAQANATWGEPFWDRAVTELSYGRELRAPLTFRHPMFRPPTDVGFPTPQINPSWEGR